MTATTTRFGAYLQLIRFDRPIGSLLLLWPTWWALWLAAEGFPPIKLLVIFSLGTLLMRSAGCAVNDLADRNLDGGVERTRQRPLVTGAVSPNEAMTLCRQRRSLYLPIYGSPWPRREYRWGIRDKQWTIWRSPPKSERKEIVHKSF